jgi:hypothetical protein
MAATAAVIGGMVWLNRKADKKKQKLSWQRYAK